MGAGEQTGVDAGRIADRIHDDAFQSLGAAALRVQLLRRQRAEERRTELLDQIEADLRAAMTSLRELIVELRDGRPAASGPAT